MWCLPLALFFRRALRAVASSITDTSLASVMVEDPGPAGPPPLPVLRFDTPRTSSRSELTTIDGHARFREAVDDLVDRRARADVDAAGRFIEQDDLRVA